MRKFSKIIKRIVIKVGSSSIEHDNGIINLQKIDELAWEISNLNNHGYEVVLVSSGSIAAGVKKLNLEKRPKDTTVKQAAASVGQVILMNTYSRAFGEYGYKIGQILLTKQIETNNEMNKNAKNTFSELLKMSVVPIVNENDTVSTYEIKFGDNDTLSAIVSRIIDADLLILLSDVDGLYTANPKKDKDAKLISEVNEITPEIEKIAGGTISLIGTGGMETKINAAKLCLEKGIDMIIANSTNMKIIKDIVKGDEIGTIFKRKNN